MTTATERALLLRIARGAITGHVTGVSPPSREALRRGLAEARSWTGMRAEAGRLVIDETTLDERRSGVFVSLHRRGELRGCIGHIEADDTLSRIVERCAVAACSADPRFPAVSPGELPEIQI